MDDKEMKISTTPPLRKGIRIIQYDSHSVTSLMNHYL